MVCVVGDGDPAFVVELGELVWVSRWRAGCGGDGGAVGGAELNAVLVVGLDRVAAFVEEAVVVGAEEDEVVEAGFAATRPMSPVVGVEVVAVGAAGPLAAVVVAGFEGAAERGRDGAALASDARRRSVFSGDGDRGGVAAEAAGGFGADGGAVFEFAASLRVVGEGGGVDVDDELRPPGRPFVALRVEGLVGELEQRFHLLGAGRLERRRCRRLRLCCCLPVVSAAPTDACAGGVEGRDQERAVLGGEAGVQNERAVVVPEVRDVLELVLPSGLGGADALVDAQRPRQLGGGQRNRQSQ